MEEDFISIALIVFVMAVLAETIFGLQLSFIGDRQVANTFGHITSEWLLPLLFSVVFGHL